jgi:hypothetical protein
MIQGVGLAIQVLAGVVPQSNVHVFCISIGYRMQWALAVSLG